MEIFTQLVCRTIPPPHPSTPATSAFSIFLSSSPVNARPLYLGGNSSTPLSLNGTTEGEHGPPEEEEGTDWSRNCRSRPEVQKGVATLVSSSSFLLLRLVFKLTQVWVLHELTGNWIVVGIGIIIRVDYWILGSSV